MHAVQQGGDVGGAGIPVHAHDREQHQHRADKGVEEEFEAGIDAPLAAPDADDQEHRDQAAFEQHIEQHQIEGAEHADHHGFQHQEGDHVFGDAVLDRFPAGRRCRTASGRRSAPRTAWKCRPRPCDRRCRRPASSSSRPTGSRDCGGSNCAHITSDSAKVTIVVPSAIQRAASALRQRQDQRGADQRHEGDKAEKRQAHSPPPVAMNQVASATTPSSIARA